MKILRALEQSGCYDGLDICNISGVEVMLLHAQVIEYACMQDTPTSKAQNKKGEEHPKGVASLEGDIFAGVHRDSGEVMLFPELLDYVAKEVERDASIMKQVRKAREERIFLAKASKADDKT
jgi:hypothetical protein